MRLFRVLKLLRYSRAIRRFRHAFRFAREEVVLFGSVAVLLLFLLAVGIYYFEGEAQPEEIGSVLDSLWWAVAPLATVGYGDVYPVTAGGRIFTFFRAHCGVAYRGCVQRPRCIGTVRGSPA